MVSELACASTILLARSSPGSSGCASPSIIQDVDKHLGFCGGDDNVDGSTHIRVERNVPTNHASREDINTSFYTLDDIREIMIYDLGRIS